MAQVLGLPSVSTCVPFGRNRPTASGEFSVPMGVPETDRPGGNSAVARATRLDASWVLTAQERDTHEKPRDRGRGHCARLLAELAQLQRDLLSAGGELDHGRLAALADMEVVEAEPALRQLLASIRLRARVELARLTRDGSQP